MRGSSEIWPGGDKQDLVDEDRVAYAFNHVLLNERDGVIVTPHSIPPTTVINSLPALNHVEHHTIQRQSQRGPWRGTS